MTKQLGTYCTELMDSNRLLIKQIVLASIFLYVFLQLVGFFLPIVITGCIIYLALKSVLNDNQKIIK